MIVFTMVLDNDSKRIYSVDADPDKHGKVTVNKNDWSTSYSGDTGAMRPPLWMQDRALEATKAGIPDKSFTIGFG
ncbi:hypothetical protein [Lacticaseibacillus zhaodongensis]|uniref:hypothetical protein n=1 Tax=Lacticaseibacillus zhaodongensis TaxID=2668065 RepID=UPI0012D2DF23|nr:hypothetical protein [Lacticaseibacillus zhaodongensis]